MSYCHPPSPPGPLSLVHTCRSSSSAQSSHRRVPIRSARPAATSSRHRVAPARPVTPLTQAAFSFPSLLVFSSPVRTCESLGVPRQLAPRVPVVSPCQAAISSQHWAQPGQLAVPLTQMGRGSSAHWRDPRTHERAGAAVRAATPSLHLLTLSTPRSPPPSPSTVLWGSCSPNRGAELICLPTPPSPLPPLPPLHVV